MSPTANLKTSLETSSSVASLRAELEIISILRKQNWRCFHGAFYVDSIENKSREIDVLARQFWERRTKRRRESSFINLVIEAKSAKDWQLVFSEDTSMDSNCGYTTRVWSGFIDHDQYDWIRNALKQAGVDNSRIPILVREFSQQAFSKAGIAVMPPNVEPPPASHVVTAFRETNIGKEKDLENSVLWRAMSGLRSTIDALTKAREIWHAECFSDPALQKLTSEQQLVQFKIISDISLGLVDSFHPIVVVDSNLWIVKAQSLTPVKSCRFYHLDHTGHVTWWCDIVQSDEFPSFSDALSHYYANAHKRSRSFLSKDK